MFSFSFRIDLLLPIIRYQKIHPILTLFIIPDKTTSQPVNTRVHPTLVSRRQRQQIVLCDIEIITIGIEIENVRPVVDTNTNEITNEFILNQLRYLLKQFKGRIVNSNYDFSILIPFYFALLAYISLIYNLGILSNVPNEANMILRIRPPYLRIRLLQFQKMSLKMTDH